MFSPSLFGFSGFLPQSRTLSHLGVWCECVWMVVCLPRDKQSVSPLHSKTAGSHDLKCRGSDDKKQHGFLAHCILCLFAKVHDKHLMPMCPYSFSLHCSLELGANL